MTKEREAEIRRDVAAGRWGTARVKRDPSLVRIWYGKSDTVDGLEFSMWLDSTLAPERIEQLVRRAMMVPELLAEVDALRAEVVRYTQHATAAAYLHRPQLLEAVEVDDDVVGDLPRGPVMP